MSAGSLNTPRSPHPNAQPSKESASEPLWSIVQFTTAGSTTPVLGILTGTVIRRAPDGWPSTTVALLDNWPHFSSELAALDPSVLEPVSDAALAAPITYPRKVICAGANFYSHAAEMGTPPPDSSKPPFFFLKPPTTTVIGPNALAPLPLGNDPMYDWEVELGIVIGTRAKHVTHNQARDHVAGYVVANDLSARGRFSRPFAADPFTWDWLGQKCQDGSCPIGPGIVPSWLVPNIETSAISLSVNGLVKQKSTMEDIIVDLWHLVAAASDTVTLEPGDVILAGTPAGVGMPRGTFLNVGDVLEATVEGLGTLRTVIGQPND